MELYNEEILDLFDNASCSVTKSSNGPIGGLGKRSTSAGGSTGIRIHEDANGNIYTVRKMFLTKKFEFLFFNVVHSRPEKLKKVQAKKKN